MITLLRTDSGNKDFTKLVKFLDIYLAEKDGEEHSFYAQFNKIDQVKNVVIAYENENHVSCGAIKKYEPKVMEIKRMYTIPQSRGKGIATKILCELESWAAELDFDKCILETGKRQPEAINFYKKCGYKLIPNYGQYTNVDNSLCFEKKIG